MKILVTDDHAIVQLGIQQLLEEEYPGATIAEAGTGQSATEAVHRDEWDLVVLDLCLPDKHGIDVLREIKAAGPTLPVIVLSLYSEDHYAIRVLKAGAAGYLTKESAPHLLVEAIRKVLDGGKFISPSLAERLAAEVAGELSGEPHDTLSNRELEILRFIGQGKTPTEIGDHLALSVKTISTYRSRLLEKLHLKTTPELIRYALDHRLVD